MITHFFMLYSVEVFAQEIKSNDFENIRVNQHDNTMYISSEDNLFRYNVNGIKSLLKIISDTTSLNQHKLFIMDRGIPELQVDFNVENKQSNNVSLKYIDDEKWNLIKELKPKNKSFYKTDLVLYPQFILKNKLLSKIYEIQINIAPAMEVSFWKGMMLTGQVILPIYVDDTYEEDYVRPGFLTLSQNFRLPSNWYGNITAGNFSNNRYGVDFTLNKPINKNFSFIINTGITGKSFYDSDKWQTGDLNYLTWNVVMQYYYSRFDLQFDLGYHRFLNNDDGVRFDLTRHFGEVTLGFYGMYSQNEIKEELNAGFHVAIPLSKKKIGRRNLVRLRLPKYFDWEYSATTGNSYGKGYEIKPNQNRSEHWNNPLFIEQQINK
ncbi:MAG: YjbH domain-containing protein [Ichthyobacteriaceae bacterium]|nr:YjbH domain-containing protein [Ichthyobacteriaceae bacterium]